MRLWHFSSSVISFFNAHAQPSSGARCLIFGRTLRLLPYFMCANSGCAGSPEPSLVAYVISTKISCAGSFIFESIVSVFVFIYLTVHFFLICVLRPIKIISLILCQASHVGGAKVEELEERHQAISKQNPAFSHFTLKLLKIYTPEKFAVITLKFEGGFAVE